MRRHAWWTLFDWGGTLMPEDGPLDVPMALWPEVREIEGALETLTELSRHGGIGVVTNAAVSSRNMVELALGRVGLRSLVEEVFCYTEIGARKDSPAFWRHVLARLEVGRADIAVVGDTLEQDVFAPGESGIFSIWFNEGGARPGDPRGHPVVHRLADVVPIVLARRASR